MSNNVIRLFSCGSGNQEASYCTNCTPAIIFGALVALVVFLVLGFWSALAPISSAAIAPGVVVVDSNRKVVQHLEGGVIREKFVRNGSFVEAGQVLLRLDGANVRAAIASLQILRRINAAVKARLWAERSFSNNIDFPANLIALAEEDENVAQILTGQRRIFQTRRTALLGDIDIIDNRIEQSNRKLDGLKTQEKSKNHEIKLIDEELSAVGNLLELGFATKKRYMALQRSINQSMSELEEYKAKIEEIDSLSRHYELEKEQIQKSFMEDVENYVFQNERESHKLVEEMQAMEDKYRRLDLRAPASGIVVNMPPHTVGGVIAPGGRVLDIVPRDDELVVQAQVSPTDIERVRIGLPADVRFPGVGSEMPRLNGFVVMVSADRVTDDSVGSSYFEARVEVEDSEIEKLNGIELIPGMPAEVIIRKEERTLLNYLFSPLTYVIRTSFRE